MKTNYFALAQKICHQGIPLTESPSGGNPDSEGAAKVTGQADLSLPWTKNGLDILDCNQSWVASCDTCEVQDFIVDKANQGSEECTQSTPVDSAVQHCGSENQRGGDYFSRELRGDVIYDY